MREVAVNYYYDLHCHSVKSSDALSTILELTDYAKKKELKLIAVTEHGCGMIDGPHPTYFEVSPRVPPVINDVVVLSGCEANIVDSSGNIDLEEGKAALQDIVIAGIHNLTTYNTNSSVKENTQALIGAMANKYVDIICHPYRSSYPVDVEELVEAAIKYGVLLEVNAHVLKNSNEAGSVMLNTKKMIELCEKHNHPMAAGSDAHIAFEVGEFSVFEKMGINTGLFNIFDFKRKDLRLINRLCESKKGYKDLIVNQEKLK